MRILLLERDGLAAQRVLRVLTAGGYHDVTRVTRGEDALRLAAATRYDLVLLDGPNEDMAGAEVLARMRGDDPQARVLALYHLGGTDGAGDWPDEQLNEDYADEELIGRVRILLATARPDVPPEILVRGRLRIRVRGRSVRWDDRCIELSPKEFEILHFLAENAGRIVSRQMIWDACWPEYRIPPQVNVIDVNLSRLRAKLDAVIDAPLVQTVRKQGFLIPAA